MLIKRESIKNLVFIRLNSGDDILASLAEAAEKNGIKNAVILSGIGSVSDHHFHVVASRTNPINALARAYWAGPQLPWYFCKTLLTNSVKNA